MIEHNPAHEAVTKALRTKELVRPASCEVCGMECKPYAHHFDYSKYLEVIWLCAKCHASEHKRLREIARVQLNIVFNESVIIAKRIVDLTPSGLVYG